MGVEEPVRAALVRGLAWAVYEQNDEVLWARVRDTASNLLTSYWRNGEFVGAKPAEAFYVRCGSDTMTLEDLDNGRLIVLVGIAPGTPAEFVVLRIEQMIGGQRRQGLLRRWFARAVLAPDEGRLRTSTAPYRGAADPRVTLRSQMREGGDWGAAASG